MEEEAELQDRVIEVLNVCFANHKSETKAEFAEEIGTNYLQLYRWMSGKTLPRKKALKQICEVCNVDYQTLINVEDNFGNPHRGLSIASVVSSYKDLLTKNHSDQLANVQTRHFLVSICVILVQQVFTKIGLATKLEIYQPVVTEKSTSYTNITFEHKDLLDLQVSVYGNLDSIIFKCCSSLMKNRPIAEGQVSQKDIGSLATLITRNYTKS